MSTFSDKRDEIKQQRLDRATQKKNLDRLREQHRKLGQEIDRALRTQSENSATVSALLSQRDTLAGQIAAQGLAYINVKQGALAVLLDIADLAPQWEQVEELDDATPFLLFPVRLETRFVPGNELLVRIYPDDIAIETREELLTEDEVHAAKAFWRAYLAAGADDALKLSAWRGLANAYGPNRSGWIIRTFHPAEVSVEQDGTLRVNAVPPGEPTWPAVDTKLETWSQAPNAPAMPDRFVVMGFFNGIEEIRVPGWAIPEPLICGPNPSVLKEEGEGFKEDEEFTEVDAEMKWMVDFDEAEQVGMGIRIPLTPDQAARGFDRLLVLGLRLSSDAQDGSRLLAELLSAHRYSEEGFSLLPVGTPTNNTKKDEKSGYQSFRLGDEESFKVELGEPLFQETEDWKASRDGLYLARYLGLNPDALKHVHHADGFDQRDAMAMNRLLWPATLGYYLEDMMAPYFGPETRQEAETFMSRYVSGRGPVPSIRVGDQPYGILPTTAFSRWRYPSPIGVVSNNPFVGEFSFLFFLHGILHKLDADWAEMQKKVSWAGKTGEAHKHLLDMLGLHAGSNEFYHRFAAGFLYVWNLVQLKQLNQTALDLQGLLTQWWEEIVWDLGFDRERGAPEIFNKIFFNDPTRLDGPVVDDKPPSESKPLRKITADNLNYVEWLAQKGLEDIRTQDFGQIDGKNVKAPRALLYLMLRHAVMLAWWDGAMQLQVLHGTASVADRKEAEFIQLKEKNPGQSRFKYLYEVNPTITQSDSLAVKDYMANVLAQPAVLVNTPALLALSDHRLLLNLIADRPTAKLERAFVEHLDCCTYRLDAWRTGLVTQRLLDQRFVTPPTGDTPAWTEGTYLGAFGWLENLRPKGHTFAPAPDHLPADLTQPGESPLLWDDKNLGYIHGPSLNHAITSAVLRNAYDTHADKNNPNPFAINLSSERVRTALGLIEGVRNGQPLGALLGYMLERALHDRQAESGLDFYIFHLRKAFPLYGDQLTKSEESEPIDKIEARNVIDGVRLLEQVRKPGHGNWPYGKSNLQNLTPQPSAAQKTAIADEIERIANALDAVKDLTTAEEVFQVVQGSFERAGAVTKAVNEGGNPVEPEIVQTPRSGFGLTHRVAMQVEAGLDPSAPAVNPYGALTPTAVAMTPRARMEPGINRWIAQRLPDPKKIACTVVWGDGGVSSDTVSFYELALQPIDLVYLLNVASEGAMTELDRRVARVVRDKNTLNDAEQLTIRYADKTGLAADEISFFELMPLVAGFQNLIWKSRPLHAEDLFLPPREELETPPNPKGYDHAELKTRVQSLISDFQTAKTTADNALTALEAAGAGAAEMTAMRAALYAVSQYGITAFPANTRDTDAEALAELLNQAQGVKKDLATILTTATEAASTAPTASPEAVVQGQIAACQAILGEAFRLLPLFTLRDNGAEIAKVIASGTMLNNVEGLLPMDDWLHGLARVREPMAHLEMATLMAENFQGQAIALTPLQLPWKENDTWLGLNVPDTYQLEGDKLLLAVHYAVPFAQGAAQAGLLVDEWTEVLPTTRETTGLAFHFDRPNSEPPNTLLLAVTPQITGTWLWDDLVATLHETLDNAKKRAVEPEQIEESKYGHVLPAIMLAASWTMNTVATNLLANMIPLFIDIEQGGG